MEKEPLIAYLDRPLTEGDLAQLDRPRDTKAPALKRLSTRHHRLARMLAEGFAPGEAAVACGYVISRVSILQDDPSFTHLVAHYKAQVDAQYIGLHERLSALSETAADILQERMEDDDEQFDNEDLRKIVALGADRTGYGPSSTQTHNVTIGFGARLEAARARVKQQITEEAEVIDVEHKSRG
jgi:hypothetical protein